METSTIYSMGTALARAQENGLLVEVLISGVWLTGRVVACDGHGVVLESSDHEHAVARLESVLAVRVHDDVPARVAIPNQASAY